MVHITKSKDIVYKEQQVGVVSQSKTERPLYKVTTLQVLHVRSFMLFFMNSVISLKNPRLINLIKLFESIKSKEVTFL